MQISKVTIPIADQDRALKFYTQALGFEVVKDTPFGPGQRWIELRLPGQSIEVVLFTTDQDRPRIGSFQPVLFTAADIQKEYELLRSRGVEFTDPPKKEPWGTSAIFKDRDGNTFCLASDA
jgi:catechol 2,3-dioxygenase-like lactoylglutathione lyase family enzyme